MVYEAGKRLTKREIDLFENAKDIREIQYLGTRLVDEQCGYEPEKIAEYAIRKGYASRLGYLAETALEAAKNRGLKGLEKAERLVELLYSHRDEDYTFLFPFSDSEFDRKIRNLTMHKSTSSKNEKWHVYSFLNPSDISEYIELYLIDLRQGNRVRNALDLMKV